MKRLIEWMVKKWLPGWRLTNRKLRKDAGIKRKKVLNVQDRVNANLDAIIAEEEGKDESIS